MRYSDSVLPPSDESYVLVFDSGSTNIRAVAVDPSDIIRILSSKPEYDSKGELKVIVEPKIVKF